MNLLDALYGTQVWCENALVRRALHQRDMTIQRLPHLNGALKRLLAGTPQPQQPEVQP
jgi:hypothetical protein